MSNTGKLQVPVFAHRKMLSGLFAVLCETEVNTNEKVLRKNCLGSIACRDFDVFIDEAIRKLVTNQLYYRCMHDIWHKINNYTTKPLQ